MISMGPIIKDIPEDKRPELSSFLKTPSWTVLLTMCKEEMWRKFTAADATTATKLFGGIVVLNRLIQLINVEEVTNGLSPLFDPIWNPDLKLDAKEGIDAVLKTYKDSIRKFTFGTHAEHWQIVILLASGALDTIERILGVPEMVKKLQELKQ